MDTKELLQQCRVHQQSLTKLLIRLHLAPLSRRTLTTTALGKLGPSSVSAIFSLSSSLVLAHSTPLGFVCPFLLLLLHSFMASPSHTQFHSYISPCYLTSLCIFTCSFSLPPLPIILYLKFLRVLYIYFIFQIIFPFPICFGVLLSYVFFHFFLQIFYQMLFSLSHLTATY